MPLGFRFETKCIELPAQCVNHEVLLVGMGLCFSSFGKTLFEAFTIPSETGFYFAKTVPFQMPTLFSL